MKYSKGELREKMLRKLMSLSKKDRLKMSLDLSENLKLFLNNLSSEHLLLTKNLGAFVPMQTEPLWFESFSDNKLKWTLFLPNLLADFKMEYRKVLWEEMFTLNWKSKLSGEKAEKLALVLVPGLAFSEKGERLGRGKGFFDRYLKMSGSLKVGICFEDQIVKEIPTEAQDIEMDYMVTNQRYFKCKGDK